ncbi:Metallo-dependent phosphatase [Aaosphaeria arxii CBS 175.79]|uniref:Metallo-dependent phosphatase n=1 Tax=Aaosphaeria arxii CBS 175.79 TaxID=1450172 RepID=A0A6A5Y9S8_9PLEO|nr:Metallo-dependent phosphatase [Aaosphaeria arxii CBS 175.79]KAF2021344.1 Metallo-dependent phosphatase [Aaosphaeria arxii CBS 175.79]
MATKRSPTTEWGRFMRAPLSYLTSSTFIFISSFIPLPNPRKYIRIVCISDTHNRTPKVPDGDVVIHAGDLSNHGTIAELRPQIAWLDGLPHTTKLAIAGNHDSWLDPELRAKNGLQHESLSWKSITYLQDSETVAHVPFPDEMRTGRLSIYGSPWVPHRGVDYYAFQYTKEEAHARWHHTIPQSLDILITHTPPRYHLDVPDGGANVGMHFGCDALLEELWRTRPPLHICGHVHGARGRIVLRWDQGQRAYERACARKPGNEGWGVLELLHFEVWCDLWIVLASGVWGLAKSYAGWDHNDQKTILVNAAVWYDESGGLKVPIPVINV